MRKPIQKIVAVCCVGAMALCFASCKPDAPTDTTTEPSSVVDTTVAPGDTTVAPESTTAAPGESTTAAPVAGGITKPANAAAGVQLYNDALAKATKTTAKITRSLAEVKAGPMDILGTIDGVQEAFALENADLADAKLYKLEAGSVSGMTVTESGDNYVLNFTLNSVKEEAGAAGVVNGFGGYMYLLDFNTVNQTVMDIGKKLGGDAFNLEIKELKSMELVDGEFNVTINKTTGAMSAASISFNELIKASIITSLLGPIALPANVQGGGTVNYTVA